VDPRTLDHVAFWVADRDPIVAFCERHLGMHVITQEANFTLVGSNARRGKLTFFDAEAPRDRGPLKHVALRVSDLDAALAELRGRGAEVAAEPADRSDWGIRVAYVRDPDGTLIELNQPVPTAA
jgi:catechol 2,3-dioxygenase-like lactoylglutathione lyase family enzyme